MILFENLFKPRQLRLAVDMLLTSSVLSTTSKQFFELTSSVLSTTSKQFFELTSSVLSITSKHCFEQPEASFLVCSLILIEYEFSGCQFSLDKGRVGRGVVLPSLHTWFQVYRSCSRG